MQVLIKGISQDLSFESGSSSNYLSILLPTGHVIRALVSDEDLESITTAFVHSGGAAAQAAVARVASTEEPPRAPQPHPALLAQQPRSTDDAVGLVGDYSGVELEEPEFGGDYAQQAQSELARVGAEFAASARQVLGAAEAPAPTPNAQMPLPPMGEVPVSRRRPPTITSDEQGNPVAVGAGLVDHRALIGGEAEGDDEVGQL